MKSEDEDSEDKYRQYLSQLISRTKSRGSGRYFNQYVKRCRREASLRYPKGAEIAWKKDMKLEGSLGILAILFELFNLLG